MTNKRNFFKTLSSAALGALMVGNFSNVWMMESTDKQYEEISKQKNENFLKKRAAMNSNKDDRELYFAKRFMKILNNQPKIKRAASSRNFDIGNIAYNLSCSLINCNLMNTSSANDAIRILSEEIKNDKYPCVDTLVKSIINKLLEHTSH